MQLGGTRVQRDPDLRTQGDERVDGALLRGAHVRRGDNPDPAASGNDRPKRVTEVANPRPDDEGADEIDAVGACQLSAQLRPDVRLALSVNEQIALAERRGGCWWKLLQGPE